MQLWLDRARVQIPRFSRQLHQLWTAQGAAGVAARVRGKVARLLAPAAADLQVRKADVLAVDLSSTLRRRDAAVPLPGQSIAINWIIVPPSPGSGGATTIFRVINYLQSHGYCNRVYFYDYHDGDHRYYADIVRSYFGFHGPVGRVEDGLVDAHAVIATAWETAYPAFGAPCAGKRFYFVQDYEPFFHPVGSASVLAENTYRMGFHGLTAGRWLAQKLSADFGMVADFFDFGCDTRVYRRNVAAKRDGVVFYARPGAARRGFELGMMAMEVFSQKRPDIAIHMYGDKLGKLAFPFVDHGKVSPAQLNEIYNVCYGGLSLSMTNVSLVPHEMLAAGCIPIVNDAAHNKVVLNNAHVRYAAPNPHALAKELQGVVECAEFDDVSAAAANSVQSVDWIRAGEQVDAAIRRSLRPQATLCAASIVA